MTSEARLRLVALEKKGRFVFHGSGEELEVLEPRQAYNFSNDLQVPDDSPAIYASDRADYAIFVALMNDRNCPKGYHMSAGTENGQLVLRATRETLDQLDENSSGWVYVFDKKDFALRDEGGVEYICQNPVAPIEKIRVTKEDLSARVLISSPLA